RKEEAAPVGGAVAEGSARPVPHRHVVLTMPRLLRGIFRKRRELLLDLSQCAAEALAEYMGTRVGADTRPGVVSIATSGDLLQWHPHGPSSRPTARSRTTAPF